jgi:hypothetical protein
MVTAMTGVMVAMVAAIVMVIAPVIIPAVIVGKSHWGSIVVRTAIIISGTIRVIGPGATRKQQGGECQ